MRQNDQEEGQRGSMGGVSHVASGQITQVRLPFKVNYANMPTVQGVFCQWGITPEHHGLPSQAQGSAAKGQSPLSWPSMMCT